MAEIEKVSPAEIDAEPMNFEESFAKIESIVRQLELGTLGLDESLACYQSAVLHLQFCQRKLADAQRKVELLQNVNPDGTFEAELFDDEASTLTEKSASRSKRRSASTGVRTATKDLLP